MAKRLDIQYLPRLYQIRPKQYLLIEETSGKSKSSDAAKTCTLS